MLYEIQLPQIKKVKEEDNRATFVIEPLYSGYGMTLGNSLRRVLLSSLSGAAITAVKIDQVAHEFSTINGIKEDVVEIILNLKKLRFKVFTDEPQTLYLAKTGRGKVTSNDIKVGADVEIVNKNQHIATLDNAKAKISMEIRVEKGRGYVPVEGRENEKLEVGMIAVDALYSPVLRVRYSVENTRVGHVTDLDKLIMEIETDGTISSLDAITRAAEILVDHFAIVAGQTIPSAQPAVAQSVDNDTLNIMVEELNLSQRSTNALLNNDIKTVGDLMKLSHDEMKEIKGFGAKAFDEVTAKIKELGLKQEEE